MNVLAAAWETERLAVYDGTLDDVPRLTEVFNACSYVGKWDPVFTIQPQEELARLVTKSLAPGENPRELFKLQTIRRKDNGEIVGYFHVYHGMPRPDIVLISMFVIHPEYQRYAVGQEVVAGLAEQLKQLGDYTAIWLDVYLKNWPALRFWIAAGFTTIVEYRGDKTHGDGAYAHLVLEKKLEMRT